MRNQQEIDVALNERYELQRFKCFNCCLQIYIRMPFIRWQTMEFCSDECFKKYLQEYYNKCNKCNKMIDVNQLADFSRRIGTEIKHFCSLLCLRNYTEFIEFCHYCFGKIPNNNNETTYCNAQCKMVQQFIQNDGKLSPEGKCTDCASLRLLEIQLIYDGEYFGFCSFKCFFFLKFSCGIYAGKSEMFFFFSSSQ